MIVGVAGLEETLMLVRKPLQGNGNLACARPCLSRWQMVALSAAAAGLGAAAVFAARPGDGRAATLHLPPARATVADCSQVPEAVTCGEWSGYVVTSQNIVQVSAQFQVPSISVYCPPPSTNGAGLASGNAPGALGWAGIQGPDADGSQAIIQGGIGWACNNGQASYYAWAVTNPTNGLAVHLYPVSPGDLVTATVYAVDGFGDFQVDVQDWTEDWNQVTNVSGGPLSSGFSAVAVENDNGGVFFYPMQVTDAEMNGAPLGQLNPQLNVQDPVDYQVPDEPVPLALVPGPLDGSGQDFTFAWD
jgi:hypothetical protein